MTNVMKPVKVQAVITRHGAGTRMRYTATAGTLTATAATQTTALSWLGELITRALERDAAEQLQFAWDPANEMLWVAVPDVVHGGHRQYALRWMGTRFTIALGAGSYDERVPAADAFTGFAGVDPVLPARRTSPVTQPTGHEPVAGHTHRHWELPHAAGEVLEHSHLDGGAPHTHDPETGKQVTAP